MYVYFPFLGIFSFLTRCDHSLVRDDDRNFHLKLLHLLSCPGSCRPCHLPSLCFPAAIPIPLLLGSLPCLCPPIDFFYKFFLYIFLKPKFHTKIHCSFLFCFWLRNQVDYTRVQAFYHTINYF